MPDVNRNKDTEDNTMVKGEKIEIRNGHLSVPDKPVIPFIIGDGIGPDIWQAAVRVFDNAVDKSYQGSRAVDWKEVLAGEKAFCGGILARTVPEVGP